MASQEWVEITDDKKNEDVPGNVTNRSKGNFLPDLQMLPSKLSYFFLFGSLACLTPYFNVFLTSLGLTATQAGLITGLRAIPTFIGTPLLGILADYTGHHKTVWMLLSVTFLSLIFPIPWLAEHVNDFELGKNVTSYSNGTKSVIDIKYCTTKCGDYTMFYVMMAVMSSSGFVDLSIVSFLDTFTMDLVKKSSKKANFGRQRLFGALGFAATSFLAGVAIDHYEDEHLSDYTAAFYVFLPMFLAFIPMSFYVALKSKIKPTAGSGSAMSSNDSLLKPVLKTCGKIPNMIFLSSVLICGIFHGLLYAIIFLYMENELSSSKTAMGLTVVMGNIGEFLMFPVSNKIIKKIGGIPCLIAGIFSYFLRFLLMSFVSNPWTMLPIQLFHSFGFALFLAAMMDHVAKVSPKEIHTTMVSIVNTLKFGVGTLIANMAGGAAYDRYGGKMVFLMAAFIAFGWFCVMAAYYYGRLLFRKLHGAAIHGTASAAENKEVDCNL